MNTKLVVQAIPPGLVMVFVMLSTLSAQLSTALAQGPLTPPGSPGQTYRTLGQIEPRTPIGFAPYVIASPGSYYLTTNLSVTSGDAITIATNGVSLDLKGFTISSTDPAATNAGILINAGSHNVTISNGFIDSGVTNNGAGVYDGRGFGDGIRVSVTSGQAKNVVVRGVCVSGVRFRGIILGLGDPTLVVESCVAHTAGSTGLSADVVRDSTATECGDNGIYARQVVDSSGETTGSYAAVGATATAWHCRGKGVNGPGVSAPLAEGCFGESVSGNGVDASVANNCYGTSSTGIGLRANLSAWQCYGASGSYIGLLAPETASQCSGSCDANSYGLFAGTAIDCRGTSGAGGHGLFFNEIGAMCYGFTAGVGSSYVLGNGQAGPLYLP